LHLFINYDIFIIMKHSKNNNSPLPMIKMKKTIKKPCREVAFPDRVKQFLIALTNKKPNQMYKNVRYKIIIFAVF
jgi:hypothetical protein